MTLVYPLDHHGRQSVYIQHLRGYNEDDHPVGHTHTGQQALHLGKDLLHTFPKKSNQDLIFTRSYLRIKGRT